jgi:hypothetical protein
MHAPVISASPGGRVDGPGDQAGRLLLLIGAAVAAGEGAT